MPNNTLTVTEVQITLTLDSNSVSSGPPYNMTGCSGVITFSDNSTQPFTGWNTESIAQPQPSGAVFMLNVIDSSGVANATSVAAWCLTFLPRPGTTQASPFGNNVNTITGGAVAGAQAQAGWLFGLVPGGNYKVKNAGYWDWMVIVQLNSGGDTYAFASDPEMEVDT